MGKIYKSLDQLIGGTPVLELVNLEKRLGLEAKLLAKLEYLNPAGSVKDRVAFSMIEDAIEKGILTENSTIIEPTSGNTGIGLAALCAARGIKLIIVMPDSMSRERQLLMTAYGAQLVLTDGKLGMKGAIEKAEELERELPNAFIAGQFVNPANPAAHIKTTGPEIWEDLEGKVDIFVAGVGTGGTITGIGQFLKSKNPDVKVVAVEPAGSAVLSGGQAGPHDLQGIGGGFIPEVLDTSIYDEVITVADADAYWAARQVATTSGALVGITSGAATFAGIQLAKRPENKGKNIVVLLPDTGDRYLSTKLFTSEIWDIYDENEELTGRHMIRNDWNMKPGDFHLTVLGVVKNKDGKFLINRRSRNKEWGALWWEVPGGGVSADESSEDAVKREILEETGLDVSGAKGGYSFSYKSESPQEKNNYFVDIYCYEMDFDESEVSVQESEVEEFALMTAEEIRKEGEKGVFLHYKRMTRLFEEN